MKKVLLLLGVILMSTLGFFACGEQDCKDDPDCIYIDAGDGHWEEINADDGHCECAD